MSAALITGTLFLAWRQVAPPADALAGYRASVVGKVLHVLEYKNGKTVAAVEEGSGLVARFQWTGVSAKHRHRAMLWAESLASTKAGAQ